MSEAPPRSSEIPTDATWRADLEKWEAVSLDAAGRKTGEARLYRPDGTLYMRCAYAAGLEEGPFTVFHPGGQLAREGRYTKGELDGAVITRVDPTGAGEPLRSCCVPEPAVEMRTAYERGQLVHERFYDAEGRLLLSDGSVCPDRPPGLPDSAEYDEGSGRWMVAPARADAATVPHRFYAPDGRLLEEAIIVDGYRMSARLYASDGTVMSELAFTRDGHLEGPSRRRFVDDATSPYLDARIAEVRGHHAAGRPVGRFTFHDATGAELRVVEYGPGVAPPDALVAEVLSAEPEGEAAEAFAGLADRLAAEGRIALAICAAARAAARRREADGLVAFLAAHTVALAPEPALTLASEAATTTTDTTSVLFSALVAGGDPAELLRALSSACAQAGTASARGVLDLAEASLLLAPDRPTGFLSRALARLEVGDDGGALADARQLEPVSPESAAFVRDYARFLLPEWGFWPARERWGEAAEGVPDEPAQPLEAIVRVLKVYATRLTQLRAAVIARAPRRARAAWLPPAPAELLPDGPIELAHFTTTITDETESGPETVEVTIDERLDLAPLGLSSLMQLARGDWAALTMLAWSIGLDRLTLPTEITPRKDFAAAALAGITRYFRAQDSLVTGGLRSRTAGVPSFDFHGHDVDTLSRPIAELAYHETRELRALYLWLLSPENHSPFQSDLRET